MLKPQNKRRLRVLCATAASFAFILCLCSCQSTHPQTGIVTIAIAPEPIRTNVKRFGINLSGQSFYDSAQMLRSLLFRNPGFEGETWQSILRCKTVTATTCTDQNEHTVWPANFLQNAHYEIVTGSSPGVSGTVQSSTVAAQGRGVTLTLDHAPAAGDFLLVRMEIPGHAEAGWWTALNGGASLTTEFQDLSPNTPGKQALRIEASGPNQSAAVSSYFDSMQGHSFVQLHTHLTLTFRAKALNSKLTTSNLQLSDHAVAIKPAAVFVKLERLDTTHGLHTFFAKSIPSPPSGTTTPSKSPPTTSPTPSAPSASPSPSPRPPRCSTTSP